MNRSTPYCSHPCPFSFSVSFTTALGQSCGWLASWWQKQKPKAGLPIERVLGLPPAFALVYFPPWWLANTSQSLCLLCTWSERGMECRCQRGNNSTALLFSGYKWLAWIVLAGEISNRVSRGRWMGNVGKLLSLSHRRKEEKHSLLHIIQW